MTILTSTLWEFQEQQKKETEPPPQHSTTTKPSSNTQSSLPAVPKAPLLPQPPTSPIHRPRSRSLPKAPGQEPALSTNGPFLCLAALDDALMLVSDPRSQSQLVDGQGLHMGTHQPETGIVFNLDLVHALPRLLILIDLVLLLAVVMNLFAFKLLNHHRKSPSQPSPPLTNLGVGNLTTNSTSPTNTPPKSQLHSSKTNQRTTLHSSWRRAS